MDAGGARYTTPKIKYITGFHFHPSGAVYVSSYGRGLWQIKATKGCPKTYSFPWDVTPDFDLGAGDVGVLARDAPPPKPRGISAPDRPKLFVVMGEADRASQSEHLTIAGRGFAPSQDLTLRCREIEGLRTRVRTDKTGQFSTTLPLPPTLPHGTFTIEAYGSAGMLTEDEFSKPYSDEDLIERARGDGTPKTTNPPKG
jgi:hypothetical protein